MVQKRVVISVKLRIFWSLFFYVFFCHKASVCQHHQASHHSSVFILLWLTEGQGRSQLYIQCVSSHVVLAAFQPPVPLSVLHLSFRCEVENRYQGNPLKGTCYCKLNSKYQFHCMKGGTLTHLYKALPLSLIQVNLMAATWFFKSKQVSSSLMFKEKAFFFSFLFLYFFSVTDEENQKKMELTVG